MTTRIREEKDGILHSRRKMMRTMGFVFRLLLGLLFLSPIVIALIFSFVPNELLVTMPTFQDVFSNFTLENYQWIFGNIAIIRYIMNTLIVCGIVIVFQVVIASLGAYTFAFFDFPGKALFFNIILVGMMIPGQVTTVANFLTSQKLGLLNTHMGLAMPYLISGAAVFMMRQYYLTIPKDLRDAAEIDGCGDVQFLFRIAMPLSKPSMASVAIYLFVDTYNQYLWPMLVAQKSHMFTTQIGLSMLVAADQVQYGRLLAGAIISIIIPVIVFIFGQNYLIKGMADGAVKG